MTKPELRTDHTEPRTFTSTDREANSPLRTWRAGWSWKSGLFSFQLTLLGVKVSNCQLCWVSGIFENGVRRIFLIYTLPLGKKSICHLLKLFFILASLVSFSLFPALPTHTSPTRSLPGSKEKSAYLYLYWFNYFEQKLNNYIQWSGFNDDLLGIKISKQCSLSF